MGFDIAPYGQAIASVSDLLGGILKRVLPEKMSEAERAEAETKARALLYSADWTRVSAEFEDRANARALAQRDVEGGNAFTKMLSATVRPIWGFASLIVVAYPYMARPLGWPAVEIDDNTKQIIQTVIMFYFGGKVIEKVLPQMKGGK